MVELQKRKIQWAISIFLVMLYFSGLTAQAQYGGGTGEPNDPYLIYTAEQMNAIGADANDFDKHFKLMTDIDLSTYTGTNFNIIGYLRTWQDRKPFTGVFDGNGKKISNFTYISTGTNCIGLFGKVSGGNAQIKDLGLIAPNVDAGAGSSVGSLVGSNGGTITNCYVEGGSVTGNDYVGGLVGGNYRGTITNSYATGSVSGNNIVGGLVGADDGTITNCYATGSVSGSDSVGGLVGLAYEGSTVMDSFWDIETSGQTTSADGIGRTTAQMQMGGTFYAWAPDALWTIDEGADYPRLWWENKRGQIITNPYGGGSGTEADPYLVYTAEQLNNIGLITFDWDKHFKLMADIDLSAYTGTDFNIIGYYRTWQDRKPFNGVFDGNGHTISNFIYTSTGTSYVGLFGYADGAEIKDLGLIDPNVDAGSYVGSLVGWLRYGTITDCYVEGGSVSGGTLVGGLVGALNRGTITNCSATGSVTGTGWRVGGMVGYNYYGTITNCYSSGDVSGDDNVGGLLGENSWDGTIANCYSSGDVSGDEWVGGLVGSNGGTINNCYSTGSVTGNDLVGGLVGRNLIGTITNCSATGDVKAVENVGGLVGYNHHKIGNCYATAIVWGSERVGGLVGANSGTITNCYSVGSVSGTTNVGGLVGLGSATRVYTSFWDIQTSGQTVSAGGTGKTTAEMQMATTFLGWVCEPVWTIDEGADYPRLAWQNIPGETITTPAFGSMAGSGTEIDPYLIYTADELNMIGLFLCEWDKHFKLMADIDLSGLTGTHFNVIGSDYNNAFTGVFDGNGHIISNFSYTSTDRNYIGLFGDVKGENAEIKDLGLIDPNIDAWTGGGVGSLVGSLSSGAISNCYAEGGSVSGDDYVGGLVGALYSGTITNCYSSSTVSGDEDVGGLAGYNGGTITNCDATGDVSGNNCVGGLVGALNWRGTISKCYASGSVIGDSRVGGLVGALNRGTITNCYSTASVSGNERVGGLVGALHYGTISNCYATGDVSGERLVGGLVGRNYYGGTITNCYATGSVSGNHYVGGLVGYNGRNGSVSNCYSTGSVSGNELVGGLVGADHDASIVTASFWDIQTSRQATSSGGGTGLTTAEMQDINTFLNAGWDFVDESVNGTDDIWSICEGTNYPRLVWQIPAGDFLCPDGITIDDFEFFTEYWLDDNCDISNDYCQGTDLDFSGTVDVNDLEIFFENWLEGGND